LLTYLPSSFEQPKMKKDEHASQHTKQKRSCFTKPSCKKSKANQEAVSKLMRV
jgi:hypothetical protein